MRNFAQKWLAVLMVALFVVAAVTLPAQPARADDTYEYHVAVFNSNGEDVSDTGSPDMPDAEDVENTLLENYRPGDPDCGTGAVCSVDVTDSATGQTQTYFVWAFELTVDPGM